MQGHHHNLTMTLHDGGGLCPSAADGAPGPHIGGAMKMACRSRGLCRRPCFFILALCVLLTATTTVADICGYVPRGILTVSRDGQAVASFRVGLAENRDQHRQGLMRCTALSRGSGLLFIYPAPARRVFWMKNTPIALAIIFAGADGRISAIEKGEPQSTRRIHSPEGIQYVLEINYPEAGPLSIGDRIVLRLLPQ